MKQGSRVDMALSGDPQALRISIERILPARSYLGYDDRLGQRVYVHIALRPQA
jgi:hypothetical protein